MEPAGLAVGIVALAGLFNNAVDCFEYVQLGSAFGTDFQVSLLRLDILRLRLSRWGKSVGLYGDLSNAHAIRLATGPPEDIEKAGNVLGQVMDLFAKMESKSKKYQSRTGETDGDLTVLDVATNLEASAQSLHEKMRAMSIKRQNSTPLRPKVQWALYEKKRFKELLEHVTDLVNGLVECFPASREEQRRLCRAEASAIGSKDCLPALKEVTEQQDKDLNEALVDALLSKVSS
ncbi:hypothetical protein AA0114_g851 [Alternaria tenuissima]|uniref:Prion-inhibition and propagation HeLo domain-containing protein n=1 Tax=Alternaria tenuissima TaxID=119927 RepID=A0A4Q4MVL8_9PLEO|nr:hypothetical protein AA0114_g851 [Alternaria tenuissima]